MRSSPDLGSLRIIATKVRGQRWRVARWRQRTERFVLARSGTRQARPAGRILSYHGTGTADWGANDVSPDAFVAQLELARRLGYRFAKAAAVASADAGPRDLAVTFDDGLRSILAVAPYLHANGIPFTVFVVTSWANAPGDRFLSWNDLGKLKESGVSIGSHSMTHPNFRQLTPDQRRSELEGSHRAIGRELGVHPDLFAIPFGRAADWNDQCATIATAAGYRAIFAQAEDRRPPRTVGRSFVARSDGPREFRAMLEGRFDRWQEWIPP